MSAPLREVRTGQDLALASSFLGLRAEMQGRPRDALRLYQLARSAKLVNAQSYALLGRLAEMQTTWPKLTRDAALAADSREGTRPSP